METPPSFIANFNPYRKIMRVIFRNSILLITFLVSTGFLGGNLKKGHFEANLPFLIQETQWADSVLQSLSPSERIAQLFMVAAYTNKNEKHEQKIKKLIKDYGIGGLIFFKGNPTAHAIYSNRYQEMSKVPLMMGLDGEWGLSMRIDSTVKYPWQMTLGAIQEDTLIYRMGRDISRQFKRLGIHVNFAPVVDINTNPDNPIINSRSFGENKYNVARKGVAYMHGIQDGGVTACAKHFPGHGDTDKDSHKTLPVIPHTKKRLDTLELFPFRELIEAGSHGMMVAHLYIPAYSGSYNTPSTLSKPIVSGLLQQKMNFRGLVFTDALNMRGVTAMHNPGESDLKALLAGNDVLLFPEDVPKAIKEIKSAIKKGLISQEEVDRRCLKILKAKYWQGLGEFKPVKTDSLIPDLNRGEYTALNRELAKKSLTVLKNKNNILPLRGLDTLNIASISIGSDSLTPFQKQLSLYADVRHFFTDDLSFGKQKELMDSLKPFDLVITGLHKSSVNPWKTYKVTEEEQDFLNALRIEKKIILDVFTNPYSLKGVDGIHNLDGLIMSYQNDPHFQELSAQMIFGAFGSKGRLPVTVSRTYKEGSGLNTTALNRFEYSIPEEAGIDSEDLTSIDSIVAEGINEKAYPGCQVLVAKEGKVIYHKSFGKHTYEGERKVKKSDIYDLASVTKIGATLLSLMKLNDEGKLDLDYSLCDYLPELVDSTPYANLRIRDILAHQAGLQAWVPFYIKTLHRGKPKYEIYSTIKSDEYPHRVAENLYITKGYPDTIMQRILRGPIKEKEYRYSDLGYYFMKLIVEKQTREEIEDYVSENFYRPMGLNTTTYLPMDKFPAERIVPTEKDSYFRHQLIHGDVHDPGAAMLGGVGGHAGLFSNANDLAKLMQMYMNGGTYGGVRYISDSTIHEFTRCQFCLEEGIDEDDINRRGAGFDKPVRDGEGGPTCNCVSLASFGHSGFTGTIAWADPEQEVVYIFLSNRIYPSSENKKLIEMDIRTRIQEVIYQSIYNSEKSLTEMGVNPMEADTLN